MIHVTNRAGLVASALLLAGMLGTANRLMAQGCGEWEQLAAAGPGARSSAPMVYDSVRNRLVLFGGYTSDLTYTGDTWEWDGSTWSQVSVTGPSARTDAAMVFDAARGVTLLFGGLALNFRGLARNGSQSDTWQWDGTDWTRLDVPGPTRRFGHAMAYDSKRRVVVLFGGEGDGQNANDTWEWDGVEWIKRAFTGPDRRLLHSMTFDAARGVVVLFGGAGGGSRGDTWEWDGQTWTRAATTGPAPRFSHTIAYDAQLGAVVLFGGQVNNNPRNDIWIWDGIEWEEVIPDNFLQPRNSHSMAYDSGLGSVVVFGGYAGDRFFLDDTQQWINGAVITRHPVDLDINLGTPAVFAVDVRGVDQVLYQWRRNGIDLFDAGTISGSNTNQLTISPTVPADAAVYDCVVRGSCGTIVSRPALLEFIALRLFVRPTCPDGGPVEIEWEHATPAGTVLIFLGTFPGQGEVPPQYPCAGSALGLSTGPIVPIARIRSSNEAVNRIVLYFQGLAGPEGSRVITGHLGPEWCGRYMQLVDVTTCGASNVARIE